MASYTITTNDEQELALQDDLATHNRNNPGRPLTAEQFLQAEFDKRFAVILIERRASFVFDLQAALKGAPIDKLLAVREALK